MKPENILALRYLRSRKRNRLLSFLSITSVVGIMLGVATLIIVVSVMSGFADNLKDKLLGANSDIVITRFDSRPVTDYTKVLDKIINTSGVAGASPFILSQVLLTSERSVTGVVIRGVDSELEGKVSRLESFVMSDDGLKALNTADNATPSILLGRELAVTLSVSAGDYVTVVSPYGTRGAFGMMPKMKKFHVAALFDTGIYEYNSTMAYIDISAAQKFFDMPASVSGFSIASSDSSNLEPLVSTLSKELAFPYWVRDWMSMNKSLFSALKLEQFAMFIILTLIIIVASFNIVSMISITVKDKRKDIAILRAFGASSGFIRRVFMTQGLAVGVTGTILGDLLAFVISVCLKKFRIIEIPQDVYFMDTIPVNIDFSVYLLVTVCAIAITFLAAVFPANQAAKMLPIDALRND